MSPTGQQLKKMEYKLRCLENLRDSFYKRDNEDPVLMKKLTTKITNKKPENIDSEIEKIYEEYSILKIRYMMDIL